jgi:hypothetical protein
MRKTLLFILLMVLSASGVCLAQTGQTLINSKAAGTAHPSPNNLYGAQYPVLKPTQGLLSGLTLPMRRKCRSPS